MRYNPFTHHRLLTNVVIALFVIAFLLSAQAGELKPLADIAWLDILGEGGIVLMTLTWIAALLISRPPGKVTSFLVWGLGFLCFQLLSIYLMNGCINQLILGLLGLNHYLRL